MSRTETSPAAAVRRAFLEGTELALLDVREEAEFAAGHPLFAASAPIGRLETEILDRIPRPTTSVVCYDDGDGRAFSARDRLMDLGYLHVSVLRGGLEGWRSARFELFQDVNVPSKAFGELVDATLKPPSIGPTELEDALRAGSDYLVVDARRFEEFKTMSIPTATSVPGGELVYRVPAMVGRPTTTIVVNCAGRTRSIIGAQSLRNAGVTNSVVALRNGTIGWTLSGLPLDHGSSCQFPVSAVANSAIAARVRGFASRCGVEHIDLGTLDELLRRERATTYQFDVRDASEYAQRHRHGFRHAPGGQLVQETDAFAPVQGAMIVLSDNDGVRADITASWLAQMGWRTAVLDAPADGGQWAEGEWHPRHAPSPPVMTIAAGELAKLQSTDDVVVIDLERSPVYRAGHLPGAQFSLRVDLQRHLAAINPRCAVVLTSDDGSLAQWAAADLDAAASREVHVLRGGTQGWAAAGGAIEVGAERWLSEPRDVYRRPYEGTTVEAEAMEAYLEWEYGLVAQLARDGSHHFTVVSP